MTLRVALFGKVPAICLALPLACCIHSTAQAEYVPVALTGWNQDIIAEDSASSPYAGTTAAVSSYAYYEKGSHGTQGLPSGGAFTSQYNSDVTFQLQSYSGKNALVLDSSTSTGTMTLATPAQFEKLAILNESQGTNIFTWYAKLTFSDNTSTTLTGAQDPDWTASGNNALSNMGLVKRSATSWSSATYYSGNVNFFEHDFTLSEADQKKTVTAISFSTAGFKNGANVFALLGVSGVQTPEPSAFAMAVCGSLSLLAYAWRKRK